MSWGVKWFTLLVEQATFQALIVLTIFQLSVVLQQRFMPFAQLRREAWAVRSSLTGLMCLSRVQVLLHVFFLRNMVLKSCCVEFVVVQDVC